MPKEKKERLLVRAAELFDLPADAVAGLMHMEITGARDFFIENHKGILEYDETIVILNAGTHIVQIEGQALHLTAMSNAALRLSGTISAIHFQPVSP